MCNFGNNKIVIRFFENINPRDLPGQWKHLIRDVWVVKFNNIDNENIRKTLSDPRIQNIRFNLSFYHYIQFVILKINRTK